MTTVRFYRFISIMTFFFLASYTSLASADSMKSILSKSGPGDICGTVKKKIGEGRDAKLIVKTAIELGHSACMTIKCALSGGASVEKVIVGAIEAGVASAVVSRCAIDGGAEAGEISKYLLTAGISQCYLQPVGYPYTPPNTAVEPLIPDIPKNQTLSTFRF